MPFENYWDSEKRSADDLEWALVPGVQAENLAGRLENGNLTPWMETKKEKPRLLLFHNNDNQWQITKLLFFIPVGKRRLLDDLKQTAETLGVMADISEFGHTDSRRLVFSAELGSPKAIEQWDVFISEIFSLFLITGRPLRQYNCTFFLPLDLGLDEELKVGLKESAELKVRNESPIERYKIKPLASLLELHDTEKKLPADDVKHYQAYEYFCTHIQDQLFETEAENTTIRNESSVTPIVHWRIKHDELRDWRLDLINDNGSEVDRETTSASVQDISLYQYYNGLFLLGLRVGIAAEILEAKPYLAAKKQLASDGHDWWHGLVFTSQQTWAAIGKTQTEDWLRFSKTARILFAAFRQQKDEGKIAVTQLRSGNLVLASMNSRAHFSEVICYVLEQFLPDINKDSLNRRQRLRQIADERMFVHAAYTLCGPTPKSNSEAMAEFERVFSYALYVDQGSEGYSPNEWAYDQQFARKQMQKHALSRWQSIGSLSGFTDYSSIFMGFGGFHADITGPEHVPYNYTKLQIPTLFFRTTLDHFDRRITLATQDLTTNDHQSNAFRRLRCDFIGFTNNYWFRQLSPQMQGEEISSRMMAAQRLDDKYALVKDEMERADEYAATLRDRWFQHRADMAGAIAGLLAIAALVIAVIDLFNSSQAGCYALITLMLSLLLGFGYWLYKKRPDSI